MRGSDFDLPRTAAVAKDIILVRVDALNARLSSIVDTRSSIRALRSQSVRQ